MHALDDVKIAVLGLGYVGLPLAVEFGTRYQTLGFDIDATRVDELNRGIDKTLELESGDFERANKLTFSSSQSDLADCNTYIVTVPTPIDQNKKPNLSPLLSASTTVGEVIRPGDVVVFESTVFPGATEEICIPRIEEVSSLKFNTDFFAGYSPERINPGDKAHRLTTILKVTSGSTPEVADRVDRLYASIISAGTHKASSIKVAEAAKVIENTQRDLNIALINELALIFQMMQIDTREVLEAAGTKWNFLPFSPGLVGGHCIGVDPYYLTFKAQGLGYHPEVILAGRRINDSMSDHIAERVIKLMCEADINLVGARVLVLGLAFKENCPDIRNTKVVDLVESLRAYSVDVDIYDPWVSPEEAQHEYGLELVDKPAQGAYDAVVLAVAHSQFLSDLDLASLTRPASIVYDVKGQLPRNQVSERL